MCYDCIIKQYQGIIMAGGGKGTKPAKKKKTTLNPVHKSRHTVKRKRKVKGS